MTDALVSQLAIDPHNRSKGVDIAMDYYDLPSFAIVTSVALRYGDASGDVRAAGRAIDVRESMDPLARLKVWMCFNDFSLFCWTVCMSAGAVSCQSGARVLDQCTTLYTADALCVSSHLHNDRYRLLRC